MPNQKEKIFLLVYKTTEPDKLHKFIDEMCSLDDKRKYFHWATYLPNTYTLATLENSYWTVDKLTSAIYKHMEKNIRMLIIEIQNSKIQGRMPDEYWKFWNYSQNLTEYFDNLKRARKLRKITSYIKKKADLEAKEREIERKKHELEKALSLKKREEELKAKERELEQMEKELHGEPEIEEKPKKKRWWR